MADASPNPTRSISYPQARGLVLLVGLVALAIVALIMYVRRVDPAEVSATMFFLPVFVGFLFWGIRGGAAVGAAATIGYIWIRSPAIDLVGWSELIGLVIARGAGYMAFGLIGGWATEQLRESITKLDLYDQIDDATGLFNSRSLVETIDLEKSRAHRYEKIFSLVIADIRFPVGLNRRAKRNFLRDLGDRVRRSIRTVDHAVHTREGDEDVLAFVLPETSSEGARIFSGKLTEQVVALAAEHGLGLDPSAISVSVVSFPDDPLDQVAARFRRIAAVEFPEAAESVAD